MTVPRLDPDLARLLAVLDPRVVVDDLYSERGSEAYDAMTRGDGSEVREVLRIGRRTQGRILELACGSGRLTLPLGRLGRETFALDSSPRMLELLEENARRSGVRTIRPVLDDMSTFELGRTFGYIVLATTSITLLSVPARRAMLETVRAHLAPDGVFLVSVHSTGTLPSGETTRVVPVGGESPDVVVLHERADPTGGHRDVSVLRLRRDGELPRIEAFASRVHLLDERRLRAELDAAGLRVRETLRVRLTDQSRDLSMLECVR
ncbi:MAG: daptide-type RiPP biosynthesis methyltransferase [Microbacterium sp.]